MITSRMPENTALPAVVSVEEHLARVLAGVSVLPTESVSLTDAIGRVLAEDVDSATAVPPFDNSAMDGYAVRRADVITADPEHPVTLTVSADLPAGTALTPTVTSGTTARIMTGAPLPDGADAVVPIEATDRGTQTVTVFAAPREAAHIRRAGEDVAAGDRVLSAGTPLGSRQISTAASAGRRTLTVHRRPRVGVISTGSELVPPGMPLVHGQIPDSNSYLLAAAVAEAGGVPVRIGPVADDEQVLFDTMTEYAPRVDAFLLSGGVSVGAYDVVKAVLAPLGVHFGPVRMQPGKPQGFGHWSTGIPIFALPGNPVSAFVSFEVFVRPALRTMLGCRTAARPITRLQVAEGWRTPVGRRQYIPVTVTDDLVRPAARRGSGSHLVASLAQADALAIIDADIDEVHIGDTVDVMLVGP